MIKKLILLLLLLSTFKGFTQNLPTFQSPDIAALNKFIDFPVDKSTGVPQISIPIYTIKENDFSLPISLSYHAGGIKVEEQASSVGLGWALNCGGEISRNVRDKPDDGSNGYYFNYGSLYKNFDGCIFPDPSSPNSGVSHVPTDSFDKEPDMFSFSVGGYSGRFVFDQNRKVHLIPEQDVRIEPLNVNLGSWRITTPDGTQYLLSSIEHSSSNGIATTQDDYVTAWRLDQIITPNKHTINFVYQSYGYIEESIATKQYLINSQTTFSVTPIQAANTSYHGLQVTKVYSDRVEVDFNYKTTSREDVRSDGFWAALDNIQIKDKLSNSTIKKFNFGTSYFVSNVVNYADPAIYGTSWSIGAYLGKRLRLDNITECDALGNCLPPYTFSYNKYHPVATLPYRISTGRDHWGYYNGVNNNHTLLSNPISSTWSVLAQVQNSLANREPNSSLRKAFILDEIGWQTGGRTAFFYESIPYYNNTTVGGLRVSSITNISGNGQPPIVKQYEYQNPVLTESFPFYSQSVSYNFPNSGYCWGYNYNANSPCALNNTWISSEPLNVGNDLSGNFVIHQKVIEKETNNGSKESDYDVDDISAESGSINEGTYPYFQTYPMLLSGKMTYENIRDNYGNLLSETNYTYADYARPAVASNQAFRTFPMLCDNFWAEYGITSGAAYLTQKQEVTYLPNSSNTITKNTTYIYGGIPSQIDIENNIEPLHHFPTKVTETTSDGSTTIQYSKYPLDYQAAIGTINGTETWDAASKSIQEMISEYNIGTPIEGITTKQNTAGEIVMKGNLQQFMTSTNSQGNTLISLNKVLSFNSVTPIAYSPTLFSTINKTGNAYSFSNNSNYQTEAVCTQYDDLNNLLDVQTRDGIQKSFKWGYNSYYPVAQNINALSKNVFYTNFEEGDGNSTAGDSRTGNYSYIGTSSPYSKLINGLDNGSYILSYWQKNNGVWSEITNNSITVSSGSYTINISGQIDDVKFHPAKAQVSTYTYTPLVGITSVTDVKDKTLTYEYDSFLRLVNIKNNGSIVKNIQYNYTTTPDVVTPFFNAEVSYSGPGACATGLMSQGNVTYTVPAGRYMSLVSQADADQQAANDISTNAYNYINSHHVCVPLLTTILYHNDASLANGRITDVRFFQGTTEKYHFYENDLIQGRTVTPGNYTIKIYTTFPIWDYINQNGFGSIMVSNSNGDSSCLNNNGSGIFTFTIDLTTSNIVSFDMSTDTCQN